MKVVRTSLFKHGERVRIVCEHKTISGDFRRTHDFPDTASAQKWLDKHELGVKLTLTFEEIA